MNRKQKLNLESFEEIMEQRNPFGFKDENGKVKLFDDYGKVYLYTVRKLKEKFPRGYIDLSLFINEMTGMPLEECESVVKRFSVKGLEDVMFVPDIWDTKGMAFSHTLMLIMKGLHCITETEFDTMMFSRALHEFVKESK